jgi:hypothetical protein
MRYSLLAVCALLSTSLAFGAVEGTILGTVTDATGAVVANAKVIVRSEGTNFVRETVSTADGDYVAPDLAPGTYTVTVEASGFKRAVYGGLTLRVDQRLRVDASLTLGQLAETIEVTGQGQLVETESSSIGQVVDRDRVSRLPLNGRFFLQLALLSPGSNGGAPGNRQASNQEGNAVAVNGARSSSNTYLIDGVDNNAGFNGYYVISPSIDSIQEFKVQTNAYSAEFGRSAGAQVNVVTRAGSNQIHGSVFEFLRNDKLDANAWFSNAGGISSRPPFKRNQFGAALGGPVINNKTFFFANFELTRIRQAVTRVSSVPTAALLAGDFSGVGAIYDPLAVNGGARAPFAGGILPASRIAPAAKFLQGFVPAPNGPGLAGNFTRNAAYADDTNNYGFRVDQKVGSNGQLFGRFIRSPREVTNPSNFGTPAIGNGSFSSGVTETDARSLYAMGYTHVFRPNLINEFRAGYNRFVWLYYSDNQGHDFAKEAGIQGLPGDKDVIGFPLISITGFTGWGDAGFVPNITRPDATIHGADNITWIRGPHTFKGGIDFRWNDRFFLTGAAFRGSFSFNGTYTAATPQGSGIPYADYLLGFTNSASRTVGTAEAYSQSRFYHFFFQDDWKATRRLTLYLGLRYEWNPPYFAKDNRITNFNLTTGALVFADQKFDPGNLAFPTAKAISRSTIYPDKADWAPRFGFAYRLTDDNKTALRGGYGVFFNQDTGNPQVNMSLSNPPFQFNASVSPNLATPDTQMATAFAFTPTFGGAPGLEMFQWNFRNANIQHWNLSVQREVMGVLVEADYAGSKGTHLISRNSVNQPLPGAGSIQPRRPYPLFAGITYDGSFASSSYNSLQLKAEKRLSHGISFLGSYTWSKSIDNSSQFDTSSPNPQNYTSYMRGPSNFDQPHRVVLSALYELPFGRGRGYLNSGNRAVDGVLGGWNLGAIFTGASGYPFSVSIPVDRANIGTGGQRPDVVGSASVSNPSVNLWFDPNAFALPDLYTFGNAGRNILRGPNVVNLDFSLTKRFYTLEKQFLEFRCEMFNTSNTPNFSVPNSTIGNASTGRIFSVTNTARQIQFALRYEF